MKHKNKIIKILIYLLVTSLAFLIFINLWLGINKVITKSPVPKFLGFSTMYVISGSMEPAIKPGDLVIIKEQEPDKYKVGDIVTFVLHSVPYTHRIVAVDGDYFITKGDANNKQDEPVPKEKIQGKVIFTIPKIGIIVIFGKTQEGILLMFIMLVLLLYGDDILKKIRSFAK